MGFEIIGATPDGDGGVKRVLVTKKGRIYTYSITSPVIDQATEQGQAFNLNTGEISSVSTADTAVFYYKHLEDLPLFIDAAIIGVDSAAASAGSHTVTMIRNPTAGTIVSGASAGDINVNRNFDSGNSLSNSIFYKGANGNTFTDGSDYLLGYVEEGRSVASVSTILFKGNSVGFKISPNLSSGTMNVYCAIACHLVDP